MSNTYFQFKQFRIEQGRTAMKVTTDACILGAWAPVLPHVRRVLDVGAGTGLLALMLAQRCPEILVDAIELDADAAAQARENVAASPWKERINVVEANVLHHPFVGKYDLIISNPPFFSNSLLSDKDSRNMARHTSSLSYTALLQVIGDNLAQDGYACVLLPYPEYLAWKELMQAGGFTDQARLLVSHRPGSEVKRVVTVFARKNTGLESDTALVIKDNDGNYTAGFVSLLSPYYLDL